MKDNEEENLFDAELSKITTDKSDEQVIRNVLNLYIEKGKVKGDLDSRIQFLKAFSLGVQTLDAMDAPEKLTLSTERLRKLKDIPPLILELASQIANIQSLDTSLVESKLLLRYLQKEIRGEEKAKETLKEARDILGVLSHDPVFRARRERAYRLSLIWKELAYPRGIHRDELWKIFCDRHPELLDNVQDERKAKSLAFSDAKLSFLKANKGGKPNY
ncbi:hypothetical protein N8721_00895 [bacterium]|nr:hypothetical protein [bacterium]